MVDAQDAKAAALGPRHQVNMLAEVLAEPMLSTVQRQADTAAANGWFWTYQLDGVKVRCGLDGVPTPGPAANLAQQPAVFGDAAATRGQSDCLTKHRCQSVYLLSLLPNAGGGSAASASR